jgi:hypothetical protein
MIPGRARSLLGSTCHTSPRALWGGKKCGAIIAANKNIHVHAIQIGEKRVRATFFQPNNAKKAIALTTFELALQDAEDSPLGKREGVPRFLDPKVAVEPHPAAQVVLPQKRAKVLQERPRAGALAKLLAFQERKRFLLFFSFLFSKAAKKAQSN